MAHRTEDQIPPSPANQAMYKEMLLRLCEVKAKIERDAELFSPIQKEILYTRLWQRDDNPQVEHQVSLRDIGDKFDLSRERVRQIEQNLCRKIYKKYKLILQDIANKFFGETHIGDGNAREVVKCLPDIILEYAARAGG